jgi:hypothetical protein
MKDNAKEDRLRLTSIEVSSNRFFAVLLVLVTIPYFMNILTVPTIVFYFSFACFLWFGKKYRLLTAIIFLMIALVIFFFNIEPLGWGLYRMLRGVKFGVIVMNRFDGVFYAAPIIFTALAVRNLLSNIFVRFNPSISWRNYFYWGSLIIMLALVPGYPLLTGIRLRANTANVPINGRLSEVYTRQSLSFLDKYNMAGLFTSKYDTSTRKYVYHLQLKEPLKEDIQFTKVETDNEKMNVFSDKRVECINCQKSPVDSFGLVFPAGKNIDFIVRSDQVIKIIKFTETDDKTTEFIFWK